ncbi:hypothetical protein D5086_009370 [Populus alba]|uniref:Uncharacterized protein n=1 Tax=Populus alba TaxID=43335 RepID=A0ACC4CII3_POPAL
MKLTASQHLLFISHQSRISENWINKNEIPEWPSPRNEIGILPVKVNHRKQAGGRGLSRSMLFSEETVEVIMTSCKRKDVHNINKKQM